MSQPMASFASPRARASARLALLGLLAACTPGSPPAGTGLGIDSGPRQDAGPTNCAHPEEGCECTATRPTDCYLDPTTTQGSQLVCHRGTRYCREGHWSACESIVDYTVNTAGSLVSPPSAANPCNPRDFDNLLTPDPSDAAMGTNTVYNPATGGITITSMTGTSAPPGCVPSVRSCPAGYNCGSVSDGCGGTVSCGTCAGGTTCGGGGVAFHCGSPTAACTAHGCGTANCGPVDDGCGNLTASCGMCVAPQACGVGTPSRCGIPGQVLRCTQASPPAICTRVPTCPNPMTTAATSATYTFEGGSLPTGWTTTGSPAWGVVSTTAHGGTRSMQSAGLGTNSTTSISFTASTTTTLTISFWFRTDSRSGHGLLHFYLDGVDQGSWSGTTGWTQVSYTTSTPGAHTFQWSYIRDGSGLSGAANTVSVDDVVVSTSALSTGAQGTTTIRGVVTVPGHDDTATWGSADPLNNVNVFVPGSTPAAFTTSVSCDSCAAALSGDPVARTQTDIDGNFTLTDVPCGSNIPLVIQLGRWRRQVTIPNVACCDTTTLAASMTHMPRNRGEGDIPHIAMVTGNVDAMECVLRKMGVDDAEFTTSSGAGRVHIFQSNGADAGSGTAAASTLWSSSTSLSPYDMVLLACEGGANSRSAAEQQRMIDYANRGGRIFATHFHYTWLTNTWTGSADPTASAPAPFAQTANWWTDAGSTNGTLTATIDRTFTRGDTFARWLFNRGASTTLGQVDVAVVRVDARSVINPPAQQWLSTTWNVTNYTDQGYACFTTSCGWGCSHNNQCNAGDTCLSDHRCYLASTGPAPIPTHYTFDTPIGSPAANQCGRVVFSDFHVENSGGTNGVDFPGECSDGRLTAQERVLEYMLFDLASCITAPPCVPRTCAQQGRACGQAADGCGGTLDCGSCAAGDSCGGGGTPGMCGHLACTPITCASSGAVCGTGSDGCGGMISCPCSFYQPTATYTHVYASQPTPCTIDECPVWGGFTYRVDVPPGTYVEFLFQSSNTSTGFPSPPTAVLRVDPPSSGTTVSGTADVASLLLSAGARSGQYFLQVQTVLHADPSLTRAPTLQSSDVEFTCVPCN